MADNKEKLVYVPMAVDMIHPGHLNIIRVAAEHGRVMVGLFTDKAIASYKRLPFLNYDQRKTVIENIKGVDIVVAQETLDYEPNLRQYKPDIMVHGTDWREGPMRDARAKAIKVLTEWGGQLIEPEYTKGVSSTEAHIHLREIGTTPQLRLAKLKRLLNVKDITRVMEVHNGLSSLIVENAEYRAEGNPPQSFDAFWLSSLTESTAKGRPDIELVDLSARLRTINDIFEVTTKPLIFDGDTGGVPEHFTYTVRTLERLGVSAVIIEDKTGLKMNSLFGTEVTQTQETVETFCRKIKMGKNAQITQDFMIIARIESLILEQGLDDALIRANAYIRAGADGIMIHSCSKKPDEIFAFCQKYNKFEKRVPLVVVPTAYHQVYEKELIEEGVNVVIYANHLLRAAYPAMKNAAISILQHQRALESADKYCMPIKEILEILPNRCDCFGSDNSDRKSALKIKKDAA
ncbi:MAG: phosphoenolpyruvate mutase [Planctomycetaceae bacterium]|jgi:phosphoenolpyruvate phosphomutase|nr:phosphoenolpyruvate mutase [Planctomycetaceae bacterium]